MSWIETIDEGEATGRLAEAYEKVRNALGKVGNLSKVTSLKPEATNALIQLRQTIRSPDGKLSQRRQEMVAAVVSALNSCTF